MLCSMCKKNTAVIFINKQSADGKAEVEGLCYECAKKKGINPIDTMAKQANLSDKDIQDLSNKLDTMFKNLSENISDIDADELSEMMNGESEIEGAQGVPLGSIFSGLFGIKQNGDESSNYSSGGTQKVKEKTKPNKKRKALDTYGTNLTVKAKNNQIDRVVGRDKEIERMIQILNRRSKNNPCLIGEPGVGKTAIAQGLALRIASGSVPAKLLNKEVYLLDMTAVIAGTQFRGQFEARMKAIIDECRNDGNIILVIDEIHNIIGAGDAEHSMNAANILKPSLANGELQMIGTTTLKEYRKYIEKDTALERRFQPIIVEEPSVEDAISILQGIKQYYEDYHHVKISNDIIRQIVNMSEKYIHDRFLPDKAIDILDEACSKINLNDKDLYDLEVLNNQLKEVQTQKEEAAQADSTEDYQKAAELKTQECALLEQIDNLKKRMQPKDLTTQDIANVIESWTKIPVNKITEEETKKLLNLEDNLHKRIIGQNEAVEAVSRAIRRNRVGLKSTKRPPSFIFVGPTGVGKTELAKALAYEMFGSEKSIIRFDMSEYMEKHSVSKLVGSPPGYVGYEEGGQLSEKVRRNPYAVILFDEIEKAHPDVFNILLQVLDDGHITDSQGRQVDFKNTILIMTSNAGAQSIISPKKLGFASVDDEKHNYEYMKGSVMEEVRRMFKPEFLNRIDETIVFHALNRENITRIAEILLEQFAKRCKEQMDITLKISSAAKELIAKAGFDEKYGARPLKRAIQTKVEDALAQEILEGKVKAGDKVLLGVSKEEIKFSVKSEKALDK